MKSKGQAAVEFLSTYGWVLIILLVIIGGLAAMGYLSPSKLFPDKCSGSPELPCTGITLDKNSIIYNGFEPHIIIRGQNNLGRDILITDAKTTQGKCGYEDKPRIRGEEKWHQKPWLPLDLDTNIIGVSVLEGEHFNIAVRCNTYFNGADEGKRYKGEVSMEYVITDTLQKNIVLYDFHGNVEIVNTDLTK